MTQSPSEHLSDSLKRQEQITKCALRKSIEMRAMDARKARDEISRLEDEKEEWSRLALARQEVERELTLDLAAKSELSTKQALEIKQLKSIIAMLEMRLRHQAEEFNVERVRLVQRHHATIASSKQDFRDESSKFATMLARAKEEKNALQAVLEQKEARIASINSENLKLLEAFQAEQQKEEKLLEKSRSLDKQRLAARKEAEVRGARLQQMLDEVNRLKASIAREKLRVSSEREITECLESEVEKLKESMKINHGGSLEMQQKVEALEASQAALKEENSRLQSQADAFRRQCQNNSRFTQFAQLHEENRSLMNRLQRLEKLLAKRSSISRLEVRLADVATLVKTPQPPSSGRPKCGRRLSI